MQPKIDKLDEEYAETLNKYKPDRPDDNFHNKIPIADVTCEKDDKMNIR